MYIKDPFARRKPTAARHLRELDNYDNWVHYLLVGLPLSEEQTKETENVAAKYYFLLDEDSIY